MSISIKNEFGILRMTITRPVHRNSITAQMFDAMTDALLAAEKNDEIRVALFEGQESIFSAGADMDEILNAPAKIDSAMDRFFNVLRNFPKPMIAAVNGPCVGDALTLLLHCDLVYASKDALFSMPSVALARTPRFGTAHLMLEACGFGKASEKLLLSEPFGAVEAAGLRVVTGLAEDSEELEKLVASKISRLAVLPPQAVQATKKLLGLSRAQMLAKLNPIEADLYAEQSASDEAKETLDAFMHGRKPVFRKD